MRRHRKGKLRPDLDMIPLSTRHLGQSGCAKTCIRVKRLVKTNKRPFCRCRGMGRWDHQRELLTGWQHSHGLGGNIPVDWVAEIRGIRNYVDVVNNPSWTNDAATIVIVVKNNLTLAVAMHIALKLGQLAVEDGADEFNYYKDQGRYVIRMWWD